ncbi:hypothetical protein NB231_04105 [Nitrococcus mobilis Nb-231]|uniref:DUF302 domain-containing protein n=2 Tax=Nitrococcus mobilis TaxID=35797 RepID=A4BPQ5_9GAMM|nr:hypothetical protein NB231_04105 [Nitrococcus mobilis Nb-231]
MAAAIVVAALPIAAMTAELTTKQSPYSVSETLDRLENILAEKGIAVMARVDHAKNAEKVDLELRPTQLLIFGKPEIGTKLLQQDQTIGIDLPMKVLAWQDAAAQVWLGYEDPRAIAAERGLTGAKDTLQKMAEGLDNLTDAALRQ